MDDEKHPHLCFVGISPVLRTLLGCILQLFRQLRARSQEVILNREQLEDQAESEHKAQMAAYLNAKPPKANKYMGERKQERNPRMLSDMCGMCCQLKPALTTHLHLSLQNMGS